MYVCTVYFLLNKISIFFFLSCAFIWVKAQDKIAEVPQYVVTDSHIISVILQVFAYFYVQIFILNVVEKVGGWA